jgi:ATP-dependent Lhr-like helicase
VSVALSAVDPANPFGPVLPWPAHHATQRPVRRPGALVVIGGGRLRMYLAQGGRQLLTWFEPDAAGEDAALTAAAQALVIALRRGRRMTFTLELIDDAPIQRDAVTEALRAAGFSSAPRGLDWQP